MVAEKTQGENINELPSSMETENEGNEKIISVVCVWLLRKLWERMETEKSNLFFLGSNLLFCCKEKDGNGKKNETFFFFFEFLNL